MFLLEGSGASAFAILNGAESCYRSTPTVKHVISFVSKLIRNVPIVNLLEMSPFVLACSHWNAH